MVRHQLFLMYILGFVVGRVASIFPLPQRILWLTIGYLCFYLIRAYIVDAAAAEKEQSVNPGGSK